MKLTTTFSLPDHIAAGLARRELVRIGGVIQRAAGTPAAGQTVAWLREMPGATPSAQHVAGSIGAASAGLLNLVAPVASILRLGATIALGVQSLRRLDELSTQLAGLDTRISDISWAIEWGFHATLSQLGDLRRRFDAQTLADLRSAAELAWSAQFLGPTSPKRAMRLENALGNASRVAEQLIILAESEAAPLRGPFGGAAAVRLLYLDQVVSALEAQRLATVAVHLKAMVYAETGQPDLAARSYEEASKRLRDSLRSFMVPFFRGAGDGYMMLVFLIRRVSADELPIRRLGRMLMLLEGGARVEPAEAGLKIMEELRRRGSVKVDIESQLSGSPWPTERMTHLLNLLEATIEDEDRRDGAIQELNVAATQGLSWHNYRELLRVDDFPEGARLAVLEDSKRRKARKGGSPER